MTIHRSFDANPASGGTSWRRRLPVLENAYVTLRELRASDAASLVEHVCREPVLRYIAHSPCSMDGFRRFIRWAQTRRRLGTNISYGILPPDGTAPVGLLQLWPVEPDFSTAEWGFVLGDAYWGTGLFREAAQLFLDFAFDTLGVERLEARAADINGRGAGALRKLGASREGTLRRAFRQGDSFKNYEMWSILANDWAELRARDARTLQANRS